MIRSRLLVAVAACLLLCSASGWAQDADDDPPTSQSDSSDQGGLPPASVNFNPSAADRALWADARRQSGKAIFGADGLEVWRKFLAECRNDAMQELARREMEAWKDRADRNLARWGQQWLPRDQVQARRAKADELLKQADNTIKTGDAIDLYTQAAVADPFRADIPFKKSVACYKAKRLNDAVFALGEAIKLDPDHMPARNNLGVIQAQRKQWGVAMGHLARAAANGDNEVVLDNMDQVAQMADDAGSALADEAARQIDKAVAAMHQRGLHLGQTRWGDQWISEAEAQKIAAANKSTLASIKQKQGRINDYRDDYNKALNRRTNRERARGSFVSNWRGRVGVIDTRHPNNGITQAEYNRQLRAYDSDISDAADQIEKIETSVTRLRNEIATLRKSGKQPTHAGTLVLLDAGPDSRLDTIDLKANPQPSKPAGKGGLFD